MKENTNLIYMDAFVMLEWVLNFPSFKIILISLDQFFT
jgi:hypothetical protein